MGFIRPVAIVGPEAMDGPGVGGTRGRVGVPELGLQEEATRGVGAAGVLRGDKGVGTAAEWWVLRAGGCLVEGVLVKEVEGVEGGQRQRCE